MWSRNTKQAIAGPRRSSLAVTTSPSNKDTRRASVSALSFNQLAEEVYQLTKIKGSVEDLSSPTNNNINVKNNKIGEILKRFIQRRPSSDTLRQKGILKDEPVFGCSLEQITQNREPRVPDFVVRCVEVIESSEENMKTVGLYRASGNLSQVQKIRLEVDQARMDILEKEEDVHVLTGSLKLFFRELKEPLIPFHHYKSALDACGNRNKKANIKELRKIIDRFPAPNRDTLKFVLAHLVRVQSYSAANNMINSNLAIVFGPTLIWAPEDSANMAMDLMQQNHFVECLLNEYHSIFP